MNPKIFRIFSIVLLVCLISACTATATEAPAAEPTAAVVEPTTAPATGGEAPATNPTTAPVTAAEPVSFTFWSAPNTTQTAYWQSMAEAYMAEHPEVTITVNAMPESPSSEAGIQAAIAGGTAPAASENIFIGFGQQLVSSSALLPLDEMEGWDEIIAARHMEQTIQGWQFPDGHYYVLPEYSNAMLWGWRIDILKELGYDKPPRTYSEVLDVAAKLKETYPDKVLWARPALGTNTWWERWFDFFMLYDAASNGTPLSTGTEVTADDASAIAVLTFLDELSENKYLITDQVTDPFETGVEIMDAIGPWSFATWAEKYPELKLNENYVLTTPPVPDDYPADQPIKTFADTKGIAFYAQSTPEATAAAWEFVQWVYANEENDLNWLQKTSLPPARDDLSTNAAYSAYFEENPQLLAYAAELPYAVPPMAASKYTEIQTAMGDFAVVPIVTGDADPTESWQAFKDALAGYLE